MDAWRRALAALDNSSASMRLYQEYLAVDPDNREMYERLTNAQLAELERQRMAHDPLLRERQRGLALLDQGKADEAGNVLEISLKKNPQDVQIIGGLGLVRMRQGRHAEAKKLFERALALDPDNNKWSSLAGTANFWKLLRESSIAREQKQFDLADKKVRSALLIEPENSEGLALLGGILFDQGDLSGAEKYYREALKNEPANGSAIRGLSGLLAKQGRRAEAMALLDGLGDEQSEAGRKFASIRAGILRDEADALAAAGRIDKAVIELKHALSLTPENPWVRFDLARLYQKQDAVEQARAVMKDGVKMVPGDPEMGYAYALFLAGINQESEALQVLENIPSAARTPSMLSLQQRIERQKQIRLGAVADQAGSQNSDIPKRGSGGNVAGGFDFRSKPGTTGISALTATEWPIAARIPLEYGGYALIHLDAVRASAGALPLSDLTSLRQYGKIQALDLTGTASASAPEQEDQGVAVGIGYETDSLRVDLGTTPLGFPVQDIVGGIKLRRSVDPISYSLDLSRRALTSSLLSYAGVRDPATGATGEIWGGVRSSGADLRIDYDRGRFSAYSNLGYHLLTGKNVLDNSQFELRPGVDWAFIQQDDMRLIAGLVFTYWRYRENMRYYSFGHGGYYSPQSYQSLAIPVRWTGRSGRWSYLVKGSVSAATSKEKDMPYYPTDPGLQAGNPIYPGGSSNGTGYSLGTALEYQTTPHLFLGARLEIDRSDYYTPNFMTLYVRYMFDTHTDPVPFPPDPVKPYSRF